MAEAPDDKDPAAKNDESALRALPSRSGFGCCGGDAIGQWIRSFSGVDPLERSQNELRDVLKSISRNIDRNAEKMRGLLDQIEDPNDTNIGADLQHELNAVMAELEHLETQRVATDAILNDVTNRRYAETRLLAVRVMNKMDDQTARPEEEATQVMAYTQRATRRRGEEAAVAQTWSQSRAALGHPDRTKAEYEQYLSRLPTRRGLRAREPSIAAPPALLPANLYGAALKTVREGAGSSRISDRESIAASSEADSAIPRRAFADLS